MPLGYTFYPSHCFYSGYVSMQKPFRQNIPRHNKLVCKKMGLGLNKKISNPGNSPVTCTMPAHGEPWASMNTGHSSPEILKEIYERARASLCLRRQLHLQQKNALLYLFQASNAVENFERTELSLPSIWIRPREGHNSFLYLRTSLVSFVFSGCCAKIEITKYHESTVELHVHFSSNT